MGQHLPTSPPRVMWPLWLSPDVPTWVSTYFQAFPRGVEPWIPVLGNVGLAHFLACVMKTVTAELTSQEL